MAESAKLERFLEAAAEVGRALHQSESLEEALQVVVETIRRSFGAKGCLLRTLDAAGSELELVAAAGLSRAYLDKGPVRAQAELSEVFEDDLVVIDDVGSDPRIQYPEAARREGIVSIVGVPFRIVGSMRMVLRLYFDRPLDLDAGDRRALSTLAQQSAGAIKGSIQQTRYLETFRTVSSAIHAGEEIGDILESIVSNVQEIMEARGCIYWIVDTSRERVHMKVCSGFQMDSLSTVSYATLEDVFRFHAEAETFYRDIREDSRLPSRSKLGKQLVTSILGIPFPIVAHYRGVLAVYFSRPRDLSKREVSFVRDLGRQGAIALHKALRYDERLFKVFRETIEGLALALEAKDARTHGHSQNVASSALLTARRMGLPEREVDAVYHAGLLHDIGKLAMQDAILDNLGNLSAEDFETVKRHPVIGARIVRPLSLLEQAAPLILYHHERYDGSGYPEGLVGEAIPLGARILGVSDSFDAMTSDRPGGQRMGLRQALNLLQEQAGTKFDPAVVRAFVQEAEENPEAVRPVAGRGREGSVCEEPARRPSPLAAWLRKCTPGF